MTYRIRKRLFIALTILFFATVPLIVLLTQGYRVDTENKRLVKTGGIDLDIKTANTSVFLNNELKKETNFLFKGIIFRNIIPGQYQIKLEKNNYATWEKTILVAEEQVTKFFDIKLFPKELHENLILKNIVYANISPNQKHTIAYGQNPKNNTTQIFLINLENLNINPILNPENLQDIRSINWNNESSLFSITSKNSAYIGAVDSLENTKNWTNFLLNKKSTAFSLNSKIIPINTDSIFVLETNTDATTNVHYLNVNKNIAKLKLVEKAIALDIVDDQIFYLDSGGILNQISPNDSSPLELTETAIVRPTTTNAKIQIQKNSDSSLIINRGNLFLWQRGKPFEKIASNVENAIWGKEKILYWNSNDIYIYWLKELFGPPRRLPADTEHIRVASPVINADWASKEEAHIAIQTSNNLVLAEIDSRDKRITTEYKLDFVHNFIGNNLNKEAVYVIINNEFIEFNYR